MVDFIHVFTDKTALETWLASESTSRLNAEADEFSVFGAHELFTTSQQAEVRRAAPVMGPPKWKTASATFLAVYPLTSLLIPLQPTLILEAWPFLFTNAVLNLILAVAMTYVLMPAVSPFLQPWLR